jgi:hypothetical protein
VAATVEAATVEVGREEVGTVEVGREEVGMVTVAAGSRVREVEARRGNLRQ